MTCSEHHKASLFGRRPVTKRYWHTADLKIPDPLHKLCLALASAWMSTGRSERITEPPPFISSWKFCYPETNKRTAKHSKKSLRLLLALFYPHLIVLSRFALQHWRDIQTDRLDFTEKAWFRSVLNHSFHLEGQLLVVLYCYRLCWVPWRWG